MAPFPMSPMTSPPAEAQSAAVSEGRAGAASLSRGDDGAADDDAGAEGAAGAHGAGVVPHASRGSAHAARRERLAERERSLIRPGILARPRARCAVTRASATPWSSRGKLDAVLAPGQALGGYVIEQRLGAGGMGEVWRARDPKLARAVALKVLLPSCAEDPELRARFVREGRAAAAFSHPSIVTVFGAGEEGGVAFLAMELVDGSTLRAAAMGAPLATRIAWLRDLASALAVVHRAGFVHRDVKPTNVMVTREGMLKLLDFGLIMPPAGHASVAASPALTATGMLVGTPRYLAPEQWSGDRATGQADQFAWGIVAFEILTGVHPDDCSVGFGRLAGWAAPARPLRTRAAEVPAGVCAVVDCALSRSPSERFGSME
jgi:serine/threonine protein kinase